MPSRMPNRMPNHRHEPGALCFECGRAMHAAADRRTVGKSLGAPSPRPPERRTPDEGHRRRMLEHLERCRSRI